MKKPEKSLPDTNVVIRYLTRDVESLDARAKAFFDEVKEGRIKAILLESVIAESLYVLTKIYAVPKDRAAESLIDILRYKGIANDDQKVLIRALSLFCERHSLSFPRLKLALSSRRHVPNVLLMSPIPRKNHAMSM